MNVYRFIHKLCENHYFIRITQLMSLSGILVCIIFIAIELADGVLSGMFVIGRA